MRRYSWWAMMIGVLLLTLVCYSEAQVPLRMRLMTDSGDTITSNVPAIKSYFMGGDGTLTITLQEPLTFAPTDPPISLGTGVNCTLPGDGSVKASEGGTFSFNVSSADSGATLSSPVRPYNAAGGQGTFNLTTLNNGTFQWSTAIGDAGTYLAVFQAVNGAKSSQIVVMIKITPNTPPPTYTLTIANNPTNGGTVTINGQPYTAPVSGLSGSVTIVATSGAGYTFASWTAGATVLSTSGSYTFTITSSQTITANFTATAPPQTYTLTVNPNPIKLGTVTLSPPGGSYAAGTQVTITARPGFGRSFTSGQAMQPGQ